ncbi:hypothetical protein [Sandaracinus amylolyticus]|uniref:Lipoprotein n=1 Tax=Sandaracinus amylolyticus TaxID=927083 RepID=A0A0F6W5L5_9BACT|nr:hypothetical protein [Sandaracinus amylolyticus]AKF08075.1 hypothetical protein DB32_005224 [Sandaracinus amylolyticus]
MRKTILMLAMLAIACGGHDGANAGVAAGKPDEPSAGAEALVFPASAAVGEEGARRPGDGVALRVWSPTPIGVLSADALEAYRVVLEAENTGGQDLSVASSWARTRIQRANGDAIEGCLGAPVAVPDTAAIAPGGSLFVSLPAPCALESGGRYQVLVDLSIGARFGENAESVRSARHEIVVNTELPPFRGDELPPIPQR